MTHGLQIENLSFGYSDQPILNGLNLTVPSGSICAIVGQSGAGKSTLIKCLLQTERAWSGIIRYAGRSVSFTDMLDSPDRDLNGVRQFGYVPQSIFLFPYLTAIRNITLPLIEIQGQSVSRADETARDALASVGVSALADLHPWKLSGGQQQRIAIARSLAVRPAVYLLDEPTAALDGQSAKTVAGAIRADIASRDACGVVVTHNLGFAKKYCDSVALLFDGAIQWHLKTDEISIEKTLLDIV